MSDECGKLVASSNEDYGALTCRRDAGHGGECDTQPSSGNLCDVCGHSWRCGTTDPRDAQIASLRARLAEAERDGRTARLTAERDAARSEVEGAWTSIVAMTTPEQRERLGLDREVPGSHTRDLTQVVTRVCDALGEAERERDEARAEVERLRGALKRYADVLASADSLAWSYAARRDPPMLGCVGHRNCANCVRYALRWRERLLGSLAGPRQCALALYG